jgi:hypothetical protein
VAPLAPADGAVDASAEGAAEGAALGAVEAPPPLLHAATTRVNPRIAATVRRVLVISLLQG